MQIRIAGLTFGHRWCRFWHGEKITRPINRHYTCLTCHRMWPVRWELNPAPDLRITVISEQLEAHQASALLEVGQ